MDLPRDGVRAVRAAKETDGTYVNVSDADILKAIAELGTVGVFAEPAGATAYAGLVKAVSSGLVGGEAPILVLNTGSGLKDVRAAMLGPSISIPFEGGSVCVGTWQQIVLVEFDTRERNREVIVQLNEKSPNAGVGKL